jgi:hypothetical protein
LTGLAPPSRREWVHLQPGSYAQDLNGGAVELIGRPSIDDNERGIIGSDGPGHFAHAGEVANATLGNHEPARLFVAPDKQHEDLAPVWILGESNILLAQMLRLGRTHPRVPANEHDSVALGAIPGTLANCRCSDPLARDTVQFAISLNREFIAAHGSEIRPAFKAVADRHRPFGDGIAHQRIQRTQV